MISQFNTLVLLLPERKKDTKQWILLIYSGSLIYKFILQVFTFLVKIICWKCKRNVPLDQFSDAASSTVFTTQAPQNWRILNTEIEVLNFISSLSSYKTCKFNVSHCIEAWMALHGYDETCLFQ